ncbi:class I SAM-dependent methyltransferase [Spirosoma koreense]
MKTNEAIDFHDRRATQFDRKYTSSTAFMERFRVWIDLFRRHIKPEDQVMDLGCGAGIFSHYLAAAGCTVIGIDGSAAMIALCNQKKTAPAVRFVRQILPLAEPGDYNPQDVIIMSSLLEYIADADQLLDQARTLLRPNGLLFVSIPNKTSIYRRVERLLFRLTGQPRYVAYSRNSSTADAFTQQLISLGFEVVEMAYFSSHDPVSRIIKPFVARRYTNSLLVVVGRKNGLTT